MPKPHNNHIHFNLASANDDKYSTKSYIFHPDWNQDWNSDWRSDLAMPEPHNTHFHFASIIDDNDDKETQVYNILFEKF